MLIQPKPLNRLVAAILKKGGSSNEEALVVADHLVRSNLAGHDSHGVGMLPFYVRMLKANLLHPNQKPDLLKADGSIMMFDGQRGYGQAVGKIAMEQAIEKCRETGLVLMTLRNTHHLGRIGTYGEQSIAAGMVSLHFVNVTDHSPLVAPFRGSDARFSTNPICLAMPGTKKQPPAPDVPAVLLDMATSRIALGKTRVALNKDEALTDGLVINHKGQPSTDPGVMAGYLFPERPDNPPLGALTPLGEYKGYGLALFCELLGGMLSSGGTIQPENERRNSIINNMFTLVIDPARLVDVPWMQHEVEALVAHAKGSPPANPDEPVLVAGDPERISLQERQLHGIPIDDTTWEQILEGGKTLGLSQNEMLDLKA
ncbi:MAG: malate/lactate/ureidoglycolate dehydrogenase [SAR324 cluster bacterium]|nr:malate/lactate/ureidoglycolate dehydrogenase [SAR324 cluster bacterium]MBL7035221.1 malate/lactate/ureidoglycolate dehydrogenase [SAR324 cluster bacterium]